MAEEIDVIAKPISIALVNLVASAATMTARDTVTISVTEIVVLDTVIFPDSAIGPSIRPHIAPLMNSKKSQTLMAFVSAFRFFCWPASFSVTRSAV